MELKLTVEQYAKIAEMGLTAEQVQQVVDLVVPEPEPASEAPAAPDYSESFTAISTKLEGLQHQLESMSILKSGSDTPPAADPEKNLVKWFNENL